MQFGVHLRALYCLQFLHSNGTDITHTYTHIYRQTERQEDAEKFNKL